MSCFFHNIKLFLLLVAISGAIMTCQAAPAAALAVKSVRLGIHAGTTRVVVDLSDASAFRVFTLADPWRLVVDLPDYDWQADSLNHTAGTGVTSLRQGSLQPGISRIIFQLQKPAVIQNAFMIPRKGATAPRLVIDFAPASATQALAQKAHVFGHLAGGNTAATEPAVSKAQHKAAAPAAEIAPAEKSDEDAGSAPPPPDHLRGHDDTGTAVLPSRKPDLKHAQAAPSPAAQVAADAQQDLDSSTAPAVMKQPAPGEKPMIIIDPGHGGVDPGTIGAGGVYEKNVTLAAARALRDELLATGRYRVLLTRDADIYLKLHQRVDFARQHKGDLFISLHADSSPGGDDVGGASIYTLSDTASDAETERLAMRENRADLVAGVDLSDQDDDVANILVDLAMRDTMNQSKFFANTVVTNMQSHDVRTLERTHRAAGFAVLKDPDVPSILVEMGFLSNPLEAQALAKPAFQHVLAKTLTDSVDAYFTKVRQNHRT